MEEKQQEYIDLRRVVQRILENKKSFLKVLPVVFVLACGYTLCLPRYYTTEAKLVPEMENSGMGGTLGDMASMIGLDFSSMQTGDAISPLLYPDLMEDNGFVAGLFDVRVQSTFDEDMPIDTTYYAYMSKFQKKPFWQSWISAVKRLILPKSKKFTVKNGEGAAYDPYCISEYDYNLMERIRDNVMIDIDKQTGVITISVKTQDPFICRQLADAVTRQLQEYITNYRTNKARTDMEQYEQMMEAAKVEYDKARALYTKRADANMNSILTRVSSDVEDLENEMQLKYNSYTMMVTQYQAAMTKVQARTPVFSALKSATVPVKHAGPKRMIMVIGILILAFIVQSTLLFTKDIKNYMAGR
ncbi:MAG: chain-length determining protein [Bacteroidaceae bacterium]|nr:chain-length determining protein [Bacteroidaceae bacterium]